MAYVHDLQHAAEDARDDQALTSAGRPIPEHHHDESNCHVHAQLHMPAIAAASTIFAVEAGAWVAFLSELAPTPPPQLAFATIACRGPPSLRAI